MPKWNCRAVLEGRVQCREKPPGCLSEWLAVASRFRQQLGGAQRSTTLPALGAVSVLGFGGSHGPVEALSCFNLHFLDGASSHGLTFCLYLFSGEVSVRVFGPFY